MKELFQKIIYLLVVVAVGLILYFYFFGKDEPPEVTTIIVPGDSTFTVVDSIPDINLIGEDTTDIPVPGTVDPIIIYMKDTSSGKVIDTLAIKARYEKLIHKKDSLIRELMIRRNYSDTIHNAKAEIDAIIGLSVQYNRLLPDRTYFFKNNRAKVIQQPAATIDRALYWGINAGYHFDMDILFGVNLDYQVKKSLFGINLTTGFKPNNRFILLKYGKKF